LGKVISREHPEFNCTLVDLDPAGESPAESQALFDEIWHDRADHQVGFRNNGQTRLVPRLTRFSRGADRSNEEVDHTGLAARPFAVDVAKPGILDRMRLRATTRRKPGRGEVEIRVNAAGLNFLDLLRALDTRFDGGRAPYVQFGSECAGTVVAIGDE